MKFASVSDIRALDAAAQASLRKIAPGKDDALMRIAALALADAVCDLAARLPRPPLVAAVCGKGDNGGDAAIAAELLAERGFRTRVLRTERISEWSAEPAVAFPAGSIVLDGILGIGLKGAPRGAAADAIAFVNRLRETGRALVVAVDIPSGLDADTGAAPGACVTADFTVTMGLPKRGMASPGALAHCGEILVANIGYGPGACADPATDEGAGSDPATALFSAPDLPRVRPPRAWDAHKGAFGHVALAVGSERYSGAGALAALGALRGGAGLATALVPRAIAPSLAARAPELMVRAYDAPALSSAALSSLDFPLAGKVVLAGCGLSTAPGVAEGLRWLLSTPDVAAFVLDADALTLLGPLPFFLPNPATASRLVLTPHPGEAARLLGTSAAAVQADRPAAARALAAKSGSTVILKGAGTLVAAPGRPLALVAAGNPGLARGGSGDLLAGLCAGLLARGLAPYDAACAAAWLHGRAADLAALRRGPEAMLPSDLLAELS